MGIYVGWRSVGCCCALSIPHITSPTPTTIHKIRTVLNLGRAVGVVVEDDVRPVGRGLVGLVVVRVGAVRVVLDGHVLCCRQMCVCDGRVCERQRFGFLWCLCVCATVDLVVVCRPALVSYTPYTYTYIKQTCTYIFIYIYNL